MKAENIQIKGILGPDLSWNLVGDLRVKLQTLELPENLLSLMQVQ